MVELLHENSERIVIRGGDGRIIFVTDSSLEVKRIPGEKKASVHYYDFRDLVVMNKAMDEAKPFIVDGVMGLQGFIILARAMHKVFPSGC